jgi:hypothetical protein
MKVLVSSKYLYSKLRELDLENESVVRVMFLKILRDVRYENSLVLVTQKNNVTIDVEPLGIIAPVTIDQTDRRWDWIKKTVVFIPDQPIVLEISEKEVNIILTY